MWVAHLSPFYSLSLTPRFNVYFVTFFLILLFLYSSYSHSRSSHLFFFYLPLPFFLFLHFAFLNFSRAYRSFGTFPLFFTYPGSLSILPMLFWASPTFCQKIFDPVCLFSRLISSVSLVSSRVRCTLWSLVALTVDYSPSCRGVLPKNGTSGPAKWLQWARWAGDVKKRGEKAIDKRNGGPMELAINCMYAQIVETGCKQEWETRLFEHKQARSKGEEEAGGEGKRLDRVVIRFWLRN